MTFWYCTQYLRMYVQGEACVVTVVYGASGADPPTTVVKPVERSTNSKEALTNKPGCLYVRSAAEVIS